MGLIGIGSKVGFVVGKAIAGGGKNTSAAAAKKLAAQKAAFLKAHGMAFKATAPKTYPVAVKVAIGVGKGILYAGAGILGIIASQWR